MKVILCFVLVAVASSDASPMFGASGMMKRRFPGAPDMTVRTYREITNNNSGLAGSAPSPQPAVARFGPNQQDNVDQSWMFSNSGPTQVAAQPAFQYSGRPAPRPALRPAVRPAVRPAPSPVSTHQEDTSSVYQNSVDDLEFYQNYPTNFFPRKSYAHLEFPDQVSYDDYFGYEDYHKPIFMPKRHYY